MAKPRAGIAAKDLRRRDGEERNAKWRALSTADKVSSLRSRRGESKRQLAKLIGG